MHRTDCTRWISDGDEFYKGELSLPWSTSDVDSPSLTYVTVCRELYGFRPDFDDLKSEMTDADITYINEGAGLDIINWRNVLEF